MRDVVRTYQRPVFIGEIAEQARDIVLLDADTIDATRVERAVRRKAAEMAVGTFAKVVRVAGRKALHTGPFPVEGYETLETVFVSSLDAETGAVKTTRPAFHKTS